MIQAGKKANALCHPVILDPAGAGASSYRNEITERLLNEIHFTVIKGNISEIKYIASKTSSTSGVDANINDLVSDDNIKEVINFSKQLSKQTGAIIAISGAIDIVCDENHAYIIKNGHQMMSKITGTGCMLTGVIATYVASNTQDLLKATACAICMMGLSGEIAYQKIMNEHKGTSSFRTYLIDTISMMDDKILEGGMKIEIQ